MWTHEAEAVIRENWGKVRAIVIAEKIGTTKNAVCGKAQRMGLARLQEPRFKLSPEELSLRKKLRAEKARGKRSSVRLVPAKIKEPVVIGEPLRLSIFDLGEKHCRYIVAGEGYKAEFCGHDKVHGQSYCPGHLRICCHE